jgi:hypothetical protein
MCVPRNDRNDQQSPTSGAAAEANSDSQEIEAHLSLPPPARVYNKSNKLCITTTEHTKRIKRMAAHKAAMARMISIHEPAQWTSYSSNSGVSGAWMWEHQIML